VLGGGIVPGSLVLIGGDPGIGKSTLLLQVSNRLAQKYRILYVCGEESGQQVKLRASRLGVGSNSEQDAPMLPAAEGTKVEEKSSIQSRNAAADLYVLPETDLEEILRELESLKPNVAVIDSIQTIYFPALTSAPGSVAQVRECTSALMQLAKREDITLLIVGHVTKEGAIAGPKVLEHLVDTVLYFEGDRFASHRLLRSVKNRFGATHEIGVFEMIDRGLREVANPSELFLGNRDELAPGTALVVACEGTRPIVVELQALVSPTSYASPRRSTTGIDYNRLLQILAVLEKRVGIPLSKLDAYVASAGGLNVEEPAVDLGVAIAVVASFRDRIVDPHTVLIGEVGLGGQVRPVSQMELRLKEAAKLGFKRAIVPKGQTFPDLDLEIIPVAKVIDAIIAAILPQHMQEPEMPEEE
jgi:DNA repair protein RadA/Sms